MLFFYNIGILFYYFLICIASLFNHKAREWMQGRKNIFDQLGQNIDPSRHTIWFHAASLGEFEQGRPVIESFRLKFPHYRILITFFSPSGYQVRKNYEMADYVYYLPIDLKRNARRFIQTVNPNIAVFIKYEYWYNYINELEKNHIPVFVISAIFRKEQHFFRWYGSWFRSMLKKINCFFVQNQKSADLLKSIDIFSVIVNGDTRFDRVYSIAQEPVEFPQIQKLTGSHKVLLAGSSWPPDERLLTHIMKENQMVKLIIAPHEVHEERIRSIIKLFPTKNIICYSEANTKNVVSADILIIDQIGILSSVYRYCDIAYIGGGFGKGIHNILEAVAFGKPVIFGPNYHKFMEAIELISLGGAFTVSNETDAVSLFSKLIKSDELYHSASRLCKSFIENNRGATKRIIEKLSEHVVS